jgi:hypothetical protein
MDFTTTTLDGFNSIAVEEFSCSLAVVVSEGINSYK